MTANEVKILLVDDEKGFRRPMELWLKSLGYQVRSVESGEAALISLEDDRPTFIFLDIRMPGIDGIETLRRLREKYKDLPVVMLTAYATDERITEAIKLGIDGFFPKNEKFDRVYALIQAVLNRLKK